MDCRFCHTPLTREFVDLVNSPPSNAYLTAEKLNDPENFFPLKLYVCDVCHLVQIDEYKKADEIFSEDYAYFSSYSTSWLAHSKRYVDQMISRFGYDRKSLVIEVASNDGYLLQYFKEREVPVLGIEPTLSTARVAREKGIESWTEFFGVNLANRLAAEGKKANLLLGNNVLAHVPDINDFVGGIKIALADGGVVTMEFPHVFQMVMQNQFDTIYHEHFSYLSFTTVRQIFKEHGLTLFDVEELPTHGGSLRIYGRHDEDTTRPETPAVQALLKKEGKAGMTSPVFYSSFQQKVDKVKIGFLQFLLEQKKAGKKVAAYGAAAKGNTLLNYCGVRKDFISFVVDASPHKQDKFLPGSHIPIVKEQVLRETKPDYIIILPWNIREEIMTQLSYVREWNAKFVVAIPELTIL